MPPTSTSISANNPGLYFLEDDGIPGNNFSRIRFPNGTFVNFEHPTDDLNFSSIVAGVDLTINLVDSLGTSNLTAGSLTDPGLSPESITVRELTTTATVTLAATLNIREGGSDSAADIVAASLQLSAGTGIGTAGNALETQAGSLEAETDTGGINIRNFGSIQIGGLSDQVSGLSVLTSGNISVTAFGSIFLSETDLDVVNPPPAALESVHGGDTSGNVALIANGINSDIIANTNNDAITAPRGSITLSAGRDIAFGTIGANFDNDVRANDSITINAGRDFIVDGFSDIASDGFGLSTGGDLIINVGRNVHVRNVAGTDASVSATGGAGADVILTTGFGGALILDAPTVDALSSTSGDVIVNADRMLIATTSGMSSFDGSSQVMLRPATDGRAIDLGSATDAAFGLELSDTELDRIFTPSLVVGGPDAGAVTVSASISPLNATDLTMQSGTDITFNGGVGVTVTGDLTLRAGDDISLIAGSSVAAGGVFTGFVDFGNTDPGTGGTAFVDPGFATAVRFFGNADADTLSGGAGHDSLTGSGGDDVLNGLAGNDTLDGGGSGDTMTGGLDDDTYIVNHAGDTPVEAVGEGVDEVHSHVDYTLLADFENLTLLGTADIDGTGNTAVNTITGNSGANSLIGGGGNDSLVGGDGNDSLNGGSGDDRLNGGDGGDELNGGTGDDTLTGAVGADRYQFKNALDAATNVDRIVDFSGNDLIHLDDAIFSNIGAALNASEFRVGAAAVDADDRIIYNSATGAMFYDADGAGGAAHIRFATLDPGLALSNADFLMV